MNPSDSNELGTSPLGTVRRAAAVLAMLLVGMILGVLTLAFFMAGDLYEYQDTVDGVHLPSVDAIVCLAGGRGRIAAAGDIWYRYRESRNHLPELYLSGLGPQSTWNLLGRQFRSGVRDVIRPENVIIEKESFNTVANARWLARYAVEHNWSRILLMTSPYHMKRARYIFERVASGMGKRLAIETLSVYQEPFEPGEWRTNLHGIKVTVIEYVKWVYYRYFWKPETGM
ncbi:MAG TPA: YdcF family protein [Bdellovibrionota bacterium]|nr:YdcF family protein [Bdellovibrionota bacterium]